MFLIFYLFGWKRVGDLPSSDNKIRQLRESESMLINMQELSDWKIAIILIKILKSVMEKEETIIKLL